MASHFAAECRKVTGTKIPSFPQRVCHVSPCSGKPTRERQPLEATVIRTTSLVLALLVPVPCAAQYSFTTVDYPGAAITRLIGINDHLEMVGHYIMPGAGQVRHAMKFVDGQFEALDPDGILGTSTSAANQINNRGDISGWYSAQPGTRHGYILSDGVVRTIDYPGTDFTQVNGITDTGVIFGHFRDSAGRFHGFILRGEVFTQLDFPGALNTFPFYINARGDIAGEWNTTAGEIGHGFVLTKTGEWITIDAPGAPPNSTLAIGINDHHQVLGYYRRLDGPLQTFIVNARKLEAENFTFVDLPGTGATPETMNNAGVFVGFYSDANGTHGLIADPDPRH
jgi:uncharacterized membrane protein